MREDKISWYVFKARKSPASSCGSMMLYVHSNMCVLEGGTLGQRRNVLSSCFLPAHMRLRLHAD